jgi:polyisoprenoid-binding protein YceI
LGFLNHGKLKKTMTKDHWVVRKNKRLAFGIAAFLVAFTVAAFAQSRQLQFDPQQTTINYTLGDVLHTVHGTFSLKQGALQFDPAGGKISGQIVVDAKSGNSGNGMRDRKMHHEVLESDRFPEITFRPDRVDGAVAPQGKSSVQVHGIFSIHGADHELTVPADVQMSPDRWSATLHFGVPYVKWGLKNPSNLFLKVSESVDIDITTSGNVSHP